MDLSKISIVGDVFKQEASDKLTGAFNLQTMYDKWVEVFELLTQNEEYQRKLREKHEKYGYLRSGEGTPAEIHKKVTELE